MALINDLYDDVDKAKTEAEIKAKTAKDAEEAAKQKVEEQKKDDKSANLF
jgi:hypothetical protein